jgi:hypothetical protein
VPIYFYHLHEGANVIADPEGVLLANENTARAVAHRHIRDLVAGEVKSNGSIGLDRVLQVCNPSDRELFVMRFEEAITIRTRG